MKIISLIRSDVAEEGAPTVFSVGEGDEASGSVVEKIIAMREGKMDFYPEACYVIHFTGNSVRRIIPMLEVRDLAYDSAKEKLAEEAAPELPEK